MARRKSLTKKLVDDICRHVRAGNYAKQACAIVGVPSASFYLWKKEGETGIRKAQGGQPERPARRPAIYLVEELEKALAQAEGLHVQNIMKAANSGTWQASAWWLERRDRERWGRPYREPKGAPETGKQPDETGVLVVPEKMEPAEWSKAVAKNHERLKKIREERESK